MQDGRHRPDGAVLQERGSVATLLRIAAVCILLAMVSPVVRAQSASDSAGSVQTPPAPASEGGVFDRVETSVQKQLADSLAELASLREEIVKEKVPLGQKLSELEDELIQVRREYQQTTRLLDSRTLDLSNLRSQIQARREENNYLSTLLGQYLQNFETRLHIAEIQRYRDVLDKAKLAPENSNLSESEVYQAQASLVTASLERLHEALGGTRFEGSAVDSSGLLKRGTFVLIGPAAIFRSADGQSVGTAEVRMGSLEPTVIGFESGAMAQAATEMVDNGAGEFPLDPTLGNAHKIEATKESLIEHISKGGPVMIPILTLAAAALLVALSKWVGLSRLRKPSERRIRDLLEAIGDHEENLAPKARAVGGPVGEMLLSGVDHIQEPPELVEEVMFEKILTAKLRLQRFLPFIAISASSAPLLGLLGTVTGIISTFKLITVFGSGDVKSLSAGISEALITTEFGLIVAIPSLLLHAFLSRKAKGVVDQMERAATSFMNQLGRTPYRQDDPNVLLTQLPAAVAREVLRHVNNVQSPPQSRMSVISPRYSENSAGDIMVPSVLTVNKNATVAEAIARIRTAGIDEDFHTVFVVDDQGRYLGEVRVRLLLTQPEHARMESLVDADSPSVNVDTDKEQVQDLLRRYHLATMPVLDHDGRLVGRIVRSNGG